MSDRYATLDQIANGVMNKPTGGYANNISKYNQMINLPNYPDPTYQSKFGIAGLTQDCGNYSRPIKDQKGNTFACKCNPGFRANVDECEPIVPAYEEYD